MSTSKDMVVNLYHQKIKPQPEVIQVLSPDSDRVIAFINKHFSSGWASEAKAALYRPHTTAFITVSNQTVTGFACYDATAKAFFGPTGVDAAFRGQGLGKALLLHTLAAMRENGYAYAIIGGVNEKNQRFYRHVCGAQVIDDSLHIYDRMIAKQ